MIMKRINQFNDWIALEVTNGVSTMWCGYLFAALAIYGAPGEIKAVGFPTWLAQSFLQLVLLSVIMVGQKIQAERTIKLDKKVDEHHQEHRRLLRELHDAVRNQRK